METSTARVLKGEVEQGPQATYLMFKHNSLCEEWKKKDKNSQEKPPANFVATEVTDPTDDTKKIKYIRKVKALEVYINKIWWYDTKQKYKNQFTGWKLLCEANGKFWVIDMPFGQVASMRFMQCAENIDFSEPVEFRAWKDPEKGGMAVSIKQNDVKVNQKYTKENPLDCPVPTVSTVAGKKKWNWDATLQFLFEKMNGTIIPAVDEEYNKRKAIEDAQRESDTLSSEYVDESNVEFSDEEVNDEFIRQNNEDVEKSLEEKSASESESQTEEVSESEESPTVVDDIPF